MKPFVIHPWQKQCFKNKYKNYPNLINRGKAGKTRSVIKKKSRKSRRKLDKQRLDRD